ncbi:hypothetical protein [uncultured Rhodoblastus sp.]|uniref:hypothetical protein n=1 Tax=uncultured Rhodoblastus sp. TaxID=543037 RepID=UPI0025D5AD50|nr:hypothetical protein [uncultured Rhodoblastus sp.]
MAKRQPRMRGVRTEPPPQVAEMLKATTARVRRISTAAQWLEEISHLHCLSVQHDLRLHSDDQRIVVKNGELVQIGGPYASFTVNLNAPNDCIIADFDRWLRVVRKEVASLVRKRGTPALNGEFNSGDFNSYKDLKIVEYCELLAWRGQNSRPTKADLGRWIERSDDNTNAVTATERLLRRALKRLPALAGQVEHELTQDATAEKAIRDRIRRHILRSPIFP